MNKQIEELLQKEISRKEFISLIGVGILSILGVSSLLKNLTGSFGSKLASSNSNVPMYGGDVYGGTKPSDNPLKNQ